MQTRILDLDGSLVRQKLLVRQADPVLLRMQEWGRKVRLACRHRTFVRFADQLAQLAGSDRDNRPFLTFLGSGDFHHVSLALLRRLTGSFNLLVIDNHPDWMRGVPFLHCGTWLYHAASLPNARRIFHLGGSVDFDNAYRWMAPWPMIRSGKIVVAPARRHFQGRSWARIAHHPLRPRPNQTLDPDSLSDWLTPYRAELADRPLYVSLDKDVLTASEAVVNWDSGYLTAAEVLAILEAFTNAADGEWAGMDVVGDWSPVHVCDWSKRFLHWTEHPPLDIDANEAAERNQALNLRLLEWIAQPSLERDLSLLSKR